MTNDSVKTLDAIRRLALDDLDAASDEELRSEIIEEGGDPEAVARSIAAELDAIVAAATRERAAAAKYRTTILAPAPKRRPVLARMKELIEHAFSSDPSLATAFRQGTRQSSVDIQSLYDDLVELGKIDAEGDD
jgi:deoxycytidylate deaminase